MTARPLSVDGLCRCGTPLVERAGVKVCEHCDVPHPRDPKCRRCARIGGR